MPNAVIIQWARLGDVLQTRMLLRRLRESGERRVVLCADAQFASLIALFPEVDEFWPVNLAQWSAQARHAGTHADCLESMISRLSKIERSDVEEAYVLNRSVAAAAFAEMLRPGSIRGFVRVGDDLRTPPALNWIETARREQRVLPLHLADVWAELAPPTCSPKTPLSFLTPSKSDERREANRVGFLCDAGAPAREIPEEWLMDLVAASAENGWECVLLGRRRDHESHWPDMKMGVMDSRGDTDLQHLMNAMRNLNVVIGPDTGGLHLAAALQVPVVGLYFGGATAANTGPNINDAVVLQDPAWTHDTVREVIGLMETLVQKKSLAHNQDMNFLVPHRDDFGLFYAPFSATEEHDHIMHERKQLFTMLRKQENSAAAIEEDLEYAR